MVAASFASRGASNPVTFPAYTVLNLYSASPRFLVTSASGLISVVSDCNSVFKFAVDKNLLLTPSIISSALEIVLPATSFFTCFTACARSLISSTVAPDVRAFALVLIADSTDVSSVSPSAFAERAR